MFGRKSRARERIPTIEMMIDHDGRDWIVTGNGLKLSARELYDIDRELEKALQPQINQEGRLSVFMTTNNEIIPEWIRPYMDHYFNRRLELPLQY